MGLWEGSHTGTLTKLSMKFLAAKGFCNKLSLFCPHLFLREGSLDKRVLFSFFFFFLEPDTWTHFHSCAPNRFPQQCLISLCNIHSIPWKCRASSEDLIYGNNIAIGGYHIPMSLIMWNSLIMSNLGSMRHQLFFHVFKAACNWTSRRGMEMEMENTVTEQRPGLPKRWYIRGWPMGISIPAISSLTSSDRSGSITPWQNRNLGKHTDCTLTMIRLYKTDKVLHLIHFYSNFWRAPFDGSMAVMQIWNVIKEMCALVDKTMTKVKNDYSWGLIRTDMDPLV